MGDVVQLDKFSRLPERYQRRARDIAARVAEIDALTDPAPVETVISAVVRMAKQFRPQQDEDQAEIGREYREACKDLPEWAISEATNDFLAGKVDSHTGRFMPVCAEFAKWARAIVRPFEAERAALRIEASKLIERAADEARRNRLAIERSDPAVKARVQALTEKITIGAAKKQSLTHTGLDAEKQRRLDALKKPVPFKSKIEQTKIGRS